MDSIMQNWRIDVPKAEAGGEGDAGKNES